jgi:hypothetical protein
MLRRLLSRLLSWSRLRPRTGGGFGLDPFGTSLFGGGGTSSSGGGFGLAPFGTSPFGGGGISSDGFGLAPFGTCPFGN